MPKYNAEPLADNFDAFMVSAITYVANELAEANRLKRLELLCLDIVLPKDVNINDITEDRA